jgi:hypothetical protein
MSSIFGTLPGSPSLLECLAISLQFGLDLLNGIKPASFQLQFNFLKWEKSQGVKARNTVVEELPSFCISPENGG